MIKISMRAVLVGLAILVAGVAQAQEQYPGYTSIYVNDFAGVLSPDDEAQIENLLREAKSARDHEMTVVTMRSLADYGSNGPIERYAKNLFNEWGVGNAERNDGILMLVVVNDREMRIALGSGYPARYDGIAKRIIDSKMLPEFRTGDYFAGILAGTEASLDRLQLIDRSAPLTSPERWQAERRVIGGYWANNPILQWITYIFGGIAALFGGRWALYRRPRKCPKCGRVMFRLGDVQEDQYLSESQILEEKLKSKDYGVWICKHDEHVTIEGKNKWFSGHKACPQCASRTVGTDRTVLSSATTTHTGTAQLDHSCENCDYFKSEKVIIPVRTQSSSSSSGSSSSFGGGSSSGGGASGSW